MSERLERLTNLVASLLATRRPLSLEEIVDRVPGYPEGKTAYRRQFERDKDTLRGIGVPVSVEGVGAFDADVIGYRIRPEDYYLPDLGLAEAERLALHAAVGAVRLEGGEGHEALWKLGGREGPDDVPLAALPIVPALPTLFDAYRRRCPVSFSYRGVTRDLEPHGILFRRGRWYLVGFDRLRGEPRSFRVDRLEGPVVVGPPGAFEPPGSFDPASAFGGEPWRFGDEQPVEARVLVDARHATWVAAELGEDSVVERRDDGSVVVRLVVTNQEALRSFVLGLLDAAVLLGPPELRAGHVAWLEAVAATGDGPPGREPSRDQPRRDPPGQDPPAEPPGGGRRGRVDAAGRLRRLLAVIPWIAEHQGTHVDEIAARFGIPRSELERDLELVPFCGLPPYTPDRLIDLAIVDGHVTVRFAEYLAAPLRLTPAEGFALLAAGQGLLAVPGSDPEGALAGALDKLGAALGARRALAVELDPARFLQPLREAAGRRERVELDYYSFGRDALTTRRVDPRAVFAAFGQWYLEGFCHLAGDERLFRVDRVRGLRATGERFADEGPPREGGTVYHPRVDDPRVTLTLPASAAWVVESYPTVEVETRPDGTLSVVLVVSERAWLERLLLRCGPEARVLEPAEMRGVGPAAAGRLLGAYGRPLARGACEDGGR